MSRTGGAFKRSADNTAREKKDETHLHRPCTLSTLSRLAPSAILFATLLSGWGQAAQTRAAVPSPATASQEIEPGDTPLGAQCRRDFHLLLPHPNCDQGWRVRYKVS